MKISELKPIAGVRRDIKLPLSLLGENRSINVGQIIDAVPNEIIRFGRIQGDVKNIQYVDVVEKESDFIVFDTATNQFYSAFSETKDAAGIPVTTWTYYKDWPEKSTYYDEDGNIRTDCLFLAEDGRLYYFADTTLRSAGITDTQASQIRHATPIEVASEEEMEQMIEAGEYEEGQLYFLAEEE